MNNISIKDIIHFRSEVESLGFIHPKVVDSFDVKNETMFFSCSADFVYENADPITQHFVSSLPEEFFNRDDIMIDSRVHMLKAGWYPCIPGWHLDHIPRDKDQNILLDEAKSEHIICCIGDVSPTYILTSNVSLPVNNTNLPDYGYWHPMIESMVKSGVLSMIKCKSGELVKMGTHTFHRGSQAQEDGWRLFLRASIKHGKEFKNEIRRQTQVYMDKVNAGW